jgi:alkylation response protein AidB-like acyl-CoA dehydrogenase
MTTSQAERAAELAALREAVHDLAEGSGGVAAARRLLESDAGYDPQAWRLLGQEMGLAGLGIPEQAGGAGGGLAELTVVGEELGRSLLPVPFLTSTVLCGQILARTGGVAQELIGELASGGSRIAFVGLDADGFWRPEQLTVSAEQDGESWRLTGSNDVVLDGGSAEKFLVAARTAGGCDLFIAAGDDSGVQRKALETLDPSRGQASVSLTDVAGTPLSTGGSGAGHVAAALDVALVVLAAEQIGGAAACLDMAVDYAKIRHQFSRPIGSFQVIKHKLADLLLAVEMGRSAIDRALLVEDDPDRLAEAAAVAKIWCSEAFLTAATENVHVHGGIGFTWEHDAHLYFRRSRADAVLFGDPSLYRERLATLLSW